MAAAARNLAPDYSQEAGVDPITGHSGSTQLGSLAAHHDGEFNIAPDDGLRISTAALPLLSGPSVGPPTAVGPLGEEFASSLDGND